jgi:AcrR family transcriptional regulator
VAEAARAALVSRATAYRYFQTEEDLLNEAAIHVGTALASRRVRASFDGTKDPEKRVDRAERGIHDVVYDNQFQLRLLLRASLDKWFAASESRRELPRRQARRTEWFEAALEPVRDRLDPGTYGVLLGALAMLTGVESLVVAEDILRIDRRKARQVKSWAVRALVREALRQSSAARPKTRASGRSGRP